MEHAIQGGEEAEAECVGEESTPHSTAVDFEDREWTWKVGDGATVAASSEEQAARVMEGPAATAKRGRRPDQVGVNRYCWKQVLFALKSTFSWSQKTTWRYVVRTLKMSPVPILVSSCPKENSFELFTI